MAASSQEDFDWFTVIDKRFMDQAKVYYDEQRNIIDISQNELFKGGLINSTPTYTLISRISQMISSLYYNENNNNIDNKELVKGVLTIYARGARAHIKKVKDIAVKCAKCGSETEGWKCAICGSEAVLHDPHHLHAGSDRYCMPKCKKCGKADVLCTC